MITNFVADGVFFAELNELEVLRALKLGLPERSWACYGVLRFIMESVANGCKGSSCQVYEVQDGYMISSGQPVIEYIDSALRHVLLRQDVLGIKVKIILDWHPKGKQYPKTPLPDLVTIHQPKEEGYMRPSVLATEIPLEIEVPVLAA